jgi:hypothetical protein
MAIYRAGFRLPDARGKSFFDARGKSFFDAPDRKKIKNTKYLSS